MVRKSFLRVQVKREKGTRRGVKPVSSVEILARWAAETPQILGISGEKNQPRTVGFLTSGGGNGPGFDSRLK